MPRWPSAPRGKVIFPGEIGRAAKLITQIRDQRHRVGGRVGTDHGRVLSGLPDHEKTRAALGLFALMVGLVGFLVGIGINIEMGRYTRAPCVYISVCLYSVKTRPSRPSSHLLFDLSQLSLVGHAGLYPTIGRVIPAIMARRRVFHKEEGLEPQRISGRLIAVSLQASCAQSGFRGFPSRCS